MTGRVVSFRPRDPAGKPLTDRLRELLAAVREEDVEDLSTRLSTKLDLPEGKGATALLDAAIAMDGDAIAARPTADVEPGGMIAATGVDLLPAGRSSTDG